MRPRSPRASELRPPRSALALLAGVLFGACGGEPEVEPGVPIPPPFTPRWAFEPWISKDISDADDTRAFVRGFRERDIPVGAVVIDSPWMTDYNDFQPNPSRYPSFGALVDELHADGIKVVMWCTQMLNEDSFDLELGGDTYEAPGPEYLEAQRGGWLVNEGRTYRWWKGVGAGIDFFDPDAMDFWHRLQHRVLDLGIDGWKLDFGESYITGDRVLTAAGEVSHQAYSEAYYRDFLAYGVHVRGPDFLTMVRPWDESYQFEGRFFARPEHAPVSWVGDNRRDWVGLVDALDHIFRSAAAGYAVVGSDVGGYLDRDDKDLTRTIPPDVEVFMRWTAVGAMTPFFQLHGRANLTPWTVHERVDEVVRTYRYWSWLHHELVPFFDSVARAAHATRSSVITPEGPSESWAGDWRFRVGRAFLVAPITEAGGVRDVELPSDARWYDWWRPGSEPLQGRLDAYDVGDPGRVPLFVREGAIVPLSVSSTVTGFLDAAPSAPRPLLAYWPGPRTEAFTWIQADGTEVFVEGLAGALSLSRLPVATTVQIRLEAEPGELFTNGQPTTGRWDPTRRVLSIDVEPSASARELVWR